MPTCLLVLEPPDGGVAENVMQLALGLPRHGWDVEVVGPEEATIYGALREAGVSFSRLPFERGFGHPVRDLRTFAGLLRATDRDRHDLVHAHSAKAGMLGRISARAGRVPVVYSPHCFPFVGPWKLPRRVFALGVERSLGRIGDAIVCVAEEERRVALDERVAPPERLHVVHNGSGPCEELDRDPELEAFRGEGPLAACITVLRPQKSVETFLRAAPAVLEAVPEARLAVVGDGPERQALTAEAASLGLAGRLRFLPFRAPAARQLASLDLYVLPSAWEALPIAVLEALACGVPQVATDVGGTSEAVADGVTGLLCPPGDPAAMAERIIELLRDPRRRSDMAAASRARHAQEFTLEAMVEGTAAVYERVLAARSS